jgi:hypothetical protein
MTKNPNIDQIGIINLRGLKGIVVSDGELIAPIDPSYEKRFGKLMPPIERVIFIDKTRIIGHGRVRIVFDHYCDQSAKSVVAFAIQPFKTQPQLLTSVQLGALGGHLKDYFVKQKELTGVMPLTLEMNSLFPALDLREPILLGMDSESSLRAERQSIHDDDAISADEKLRLVQALDACGLHADAVWALHTTLCGEGSQDFEPHPILPWDRCTKEERLDPHNWVLLPSALAQNFRMGLISFEDGGCSMHSEALIDDLDQFDINFNYTLYRMTERQREYMKIHREEIFDSWRTSPPWLS